MTPTPHLRGLVLETTDHPASVAKLFTALGLHTVVLDDAVAELRLDTGGVVQFRQGRAPTRITLTFAVPDLVERARALDEQRIGWDASGPNRIRIEPGDLTIDVTESTTPGLIAVTMFVADVAAAARFWRTLGLEVVDATPAAADADPTDPAELAVDVELGGVRLQLRGCGLLPPTTAHMVIRVAEPLAATVWLDHDGVDYRRDGEALTTRTPDGGCGVRLVPPRRK